MRMSTRGRYGLRVMVDLAARHGQGPVGVDDIAARQGVSANYIHVLAGALRSAALIRTVRGHGGGYELALPPARITALDVVRALEGGHAPVDCVEDATRCTRSQGCPTRDVWCQVATAVDRVLGGLTLAQLAAQPPQSPEYCI
jgi:Rrf2 family protein